MSAPKYALTIIQPWATLIVEGPKAIENRCWAPPPWIIGQVIAIHAGKKWDDAGEERAHSVGIGLAFASTWLARGAIIGTARVVGYVRESDDPWFFGPYGWLLAERVKLATLVYCRGMQKLWPIDEDVRRELVTP